MMKKSPKKSIKSLAKVAAVLWGLIFWWYHFSEKIGYIQHDVQKELKDNLWKKEILQDQETNDIIKLMGWTISQKEFDTMLARHGHKNDTIRVDSIIQADEALYKTILELQTKYANPKISFWWSFKNMETGRDEVDRARFNPLINTIKSHQLDSVLIKFDNVKSREKFWLSAMPWFSWLSWNTWQKYLLNNRIAELAHAKQLKERGMIKKSIDGSIDYISSGFDYEKTYYMPWTIEYQAHKQYEPQLIQEFIEIYKKYWDKTSNNYFWILAKFNSWFFENFKDEDKTHEYLQILDHKWDMQADYVLGKSYLELYNRNFDVGYLTLKYDTIHKKIFWKDYTAKTLFREAIWYYKKAYSLWNIGAWSELVDIACNFRRWENTDLVIEVWEDLLKNHIKELKRTEIGNIYEKLWSIYYHKKNNKRGDECYKLSYEYGWWYGY